MQFALLFSVFVIATCGLIYELIAGAIASYLLGDSVTQFSTIIGVYLFSMGIGSYLSKFFERNLISLFVRVEILIGLIGGFSAAILFIAFEWVGAFRVLLYGLVSITGTLVGLEIPLLMRILKNHFEFKDLVSKVFTFDYVGALLASLLFPLVLVPHLGLVRSAFLFGILNVAVGIWTLHVFKEQIPWMRLLRSSAIAALIALVFGFAYSEKILSFAEAASYPDKVIFAKTSKYQRIVLTKGPEDVRLFLNGNLQFSSRDEYRYHESLVHMGLATFDSPKNILILGGGDGMAAREALKYPSIETVTLVDLDSEMTRLFSENEALQRLNGNALNSPKVRIINDDAFLWMRDNKKKFDFIAIDFPDPSNFSVGKLYTNSFYRLIADALTPDGMVVIQSTSPYVAKKSFWCVVNTLNSVGFTTTPYHVFVPAFGDWGYIIASFKPFKPPTALPSGLRFMTPEIAKSLLVFSPDMVVASHDVNKLNNQILVRHFEDEWASYAH